MLNPDSQMEWVKQFYAKQHQWSQVYVGEIEDHHRDAAANIRLPNHAPPYRILELGCGGGQMAVSLALLGHDVLAIDMNPEAIIHSHHLAASQPATRVSFVEGDFYTFNPEGHFDCICYFDGFGIGTDEDQQRLLRRIAAWLSPGGRAFLDIYTPWYWRKVAGTQMNWPDVSRRYAFDTHGSRMLDTWWKTGQPDDAVTQSLRCYSPDDLDVLLHGSGLKLMSLLPGGAYDYETLTYHPSVQLEDAMQYMAILELC